MTNKFSATFGRAMICLRIRTDPPTDTCLSERCRSRQSAEMGATPASARSAHRASGSGADDDDADDDGAFENEEDGSNDDPLATANADGTSSGRAARFSAQRKNERGGGLTPVADKADDDDADELSVFVDTAAGAELGTVSLPNTD